MFPCIECATGKSRWKFRAYRLTMQTIRVCVLILDATQMDILKRSRIFEPATKQPLEADMRQPDQTDGKTTEV